MQFVKPVVIPLVRTQNFRVRVRMRGKVNLSFSENFVYMLNE